MSTVHASGEDAKSGVRRRGSSPSQVDGSRGAEAEGGGLDNQPRDLESEAGILGGILLMPELIDDVRPLVSEADFFEGINGILFREMCHLFDSGKRVDAVLLAGACKKLRGGEANQWQATGLPYLVELGKAVPRVGNVVYYAKQVRDAAIRRRMLALSSTVRLDAFDHSIEAEELAGRAEQQIHAIEDVTASPTKASKPANAVAAEAIRRLEARLAGTAVSGVGTGFTRLDEATGGFRPGELIIVAARPGMGKTALAQAIVQYVAFDCQQIPMWFSLEMPSIEVADRMLSSLAEVPLQQMRNGTISIQQRIKVQEASERMAATQFELADDPNQRVADIARACRQLKRRRGLDIVVVDYLQLIQPANGRDPRQEQVAKISRSLKLLARSLEVPVVCLAQLNRETDKQNAPPKLSHLRESGAIEQDADVVIFIHKNAPEGRGARVEEYGASCELELHLAKQRNGPCGKFPVEWHPTYVTFKDKPKEKFVAGSNDVLASWNEPQGMEDRF